MSKRKRFFSIILSIVLVLVLIPWQGIKSNASFTGTFRFDSEGKFRVIQIADIQESSGLSSRTEQLMKNMIDRYQPDLCVLTGDNQTAGSFLYRTVIGKIVDVFNSRNAKFAVTFGNHDDENGVSKDTQYNYYKSQGGDNFVDHDVSALSGSGNGVITVYGQTGNEPKYFLYVMDSNSNANGGYNNPYTDQIDYYIQNSQQYPTVPSLWFMHIIVRDVFDQCMTTTSNGTQGRSGNGSDYGSQTWYLQTDKINWPKTLMATTTQEAFKELPCPAIYNNYYTTEHRSSSQYGSRTLYESWVNYGNMLGSYYGHDHQNSFVVTTPAGIDIGFSKSCGVAAYNDGNPGVRVFDLYEDGTYASYNVTEADLTKPQVFFHRNGGTGELPPKFITANTTGQLRLNTYTKDGTTFMGWATSPTGSVAYADGASINMGTSDVHLYAKFAQTSQITFDANGGAGGTGPNVLEVGTPMPTPPVVTKTGYTLAGWLPSLPATVPNVDTTYVAQWTPNTYTINYDGNGYSSGSTASSQHTYDAAKNLTINGYAKVGYSFLGWSQTQGASTPTYTDGQSVINLTATPNGVLTFYAVWAVNSYKMTFDANGGIGSTYFTQTYGTPLSAPSVSKPGHTLQGWNPPLPSTVPAADTTFVAQWSKNVYPITFDANGGLGSAVVNTPYGEIPTPPAVSKTGHNLLGWDPELSIATGATTYTAIWEAKTYNIVFDASGGTGGASLNLTYGSPLNPPTVSRTGYTFLAWSPTVPETVPAENTVYYAVWSVNSYQITFDAAGGTGGTSTMMNYDSELVPPVVTRDGYVFNGWTPQVPPTVPAENSVYTANWVEQQEDNIIFFANGGIGGLTTTLPVGSPLISPAMSRTGYLFTGWAPVLPSTVVGGVNSYSAQWRTNSVQIGFDAAGGTGDSNSVMHYGSDLIAPFVSRPGFTFNGWSPEVPSKVPAENTVYTAQWVRNPVQITFDAAGGTGGTVMTKNFGDTLTPPNVFRDKYIFIGWSPAVPTEVVEGNRTYTAQWMYVG